jgi:hypothetical protein
MEDNFPQRPNPNDAELIKEEKAKENNPAFETPVKEEMAVKQDELPLNTNTPLNPNPLQPENPDYTLGVNKQYHDYYGKKSDDQLKADEGWHNPAYNKITTPINLENALLSFLKGKKGKVKINDFLKSYFPVSKNNAANIGNSRYVRGVLDNLHSQGKINIFNNSHDKLGDTYYPENNNNKSAQYNLDSTLIELDQ